MTSPSIFLFTLLAFASAQQMYSVDYFSGIYTLREGDPNSFSLAWGHYTHEVDKDGWGKLYLWTSKTHTSNDDTLNSYFAAGYLEAALTYEHIYNHYWSWYDYTFGQEGVSENVKKFLID